MLTNARVCTLCGHYSLHRSGKKLPRGYDTQLIEWKCCYKDCHGLAYMAVTPLERQELGRVALASLLSQMAFKDPKTGH